jgi:hypothetical protein
MNWLINTNLRNKLLLLIGVPLIGFISIMVVIFYEGNIIGDHL